MAKSNKDDRDKSVKSNDGQKVKSYRCCCWRFDKSHIGLFRPGYWVEKRETCQNYILAIVVIGGAGLLGSMFGFIFAKVTSGGWELGGSLVGALISMFIALSCVLNYNDNESDEYYRRMRERGPWWAEENIDYYKEREMRRRSYKDNGAGVSATSAQVPLSDTYSYEDVVV